MLSQFRLSVCLSVRLSHGWISQKRLKLGLDQANILPTASLSKITDADIDTDDK